MRDFLEVNRASHILARAYLRLALSPHRHSIPTSQIPLVAELAGGASTLASVAERDPSLSTGESSVHGVGERREDTSSTK